MCYRYRINLVNTSLSQKLIHNNMQKEHQESIQLGLKQCQMPYLCYHQGQWIHCNHLHQPSLSKPELKLLTINVLIAYPTKKHLLFSEERYSFIIQKICELSPDVVTLNQVTEDFCSFLLLKEQIQKNYFISPFNHKIESGFFNLIISKIQPSGCKNLRIKTLPRSVPIFYFKTENQMITVSSVHLISMEWNYQLRKVQLKDLHQRLKDIQSKMSIPFLHVIQGDFNLHSEVQNGTFQQLGFSDSWLQLYSLEENPGYTFDSLKNKMIGEIYWSFQQRRMRLDRILFKGEVKVKDIEIVLNESMCNQVEKQSIGKIKGIFSFVGDLFKSNLFRNKEEYLFPSDHFGLYSTLTLL